MSSIVPKYFYNQSSVIPYKIEEGKIKILLITSCKKKKWIFPKGVIEPRLTAKNSALKEVYEEAGCLGEIHNKIVTTYKKRKWEGICIVKVYAMYVQKLEEDWQENFRERKWFGIEQALNKISSKKIKKVVKIFKDNFYDKKSS